MLREAMIAWLVSMVAGAVLIPCAVAQGSDVAVVVNPDNPVSNVTLVDLRKILAGEKHAWPSGMRIRLIVRPPGCRERLTMLRLLGMSESDYKQYWAAQVFRGEADSEPLMVPSFGMIKEATKVLPGAIALVDARDVKPGMCVKTIKVDGLAPGEPGYPLK